MTHLCLAYPTRDRQKELQNDRGLQRGLAGEMAVELRIDRLDEFERGNDHL